MQYLNEQINYSMLNQKSREIFARHYNIKGTYRADDGKLTEALEFFCKAIELNPVDTTALFNRATIKADLGDFKGAKEDFVLVREIESKHLTHNSLDSGKINIF